MKAPLFACCVLLSLPGAVAQTGPQPVQARASVTMHVADGRVFRGQAVDVTLRIELEQRLWREQLIQLFRQQTFVAVRLDTPWARPLDGLEHRGAPPGFAGTATAVVDGAVAALRRADDVVRGGQRFAAFELVARLLPTRAGALAIPPAELRFAWASRFEEDFFGDLVPQGREDARLASGPLALAVEELPAAGRPRAFTGLVGVCTARAALDGAGPVRVGGGLLLRLELAGDGDLRPFVAPALADQTCFHVRGVREETGPGRRIVVYDLVALRAGPQAIASIEVPFFDPRAARYEVAATAPLPVDVMPAADGTTAIDATGTAIEGGGAAPSPVPDRDAPAGPASPIPGVDVLFGLLPVARAPLGTRRPTFAGPTPLSPWWLAAGLLAPWLAALGLWSQRRRAGSREQRARSRRRRLALRSFRSALADGSDRGAALARYVAAWLDCAPAAVVCPSLPGRLVHAGIDADLARAVDDSLDRLAGARFCGPVLGRGGAPPGDAALLELALRADRQLRTFERQQRTRRRSLAAAAALAALLACQPLPAQQDPVPQPDLPAQAARLFDAGDTAGAAGLYRQALDGGGFDAAALCFDLGNCAHRLGRPAESVLWYVRALRVATDHFEARANLRLVRQQLGLAEAGESALARVWLDGALARLGAVGPGPLLGLGVVMQLGGWVLLWLRRRRGAAIALLAAGLALAGVAAADGLGPRHETAVVVRDGVRLQAEPHERSGAVAALPAGETIAVLESSPRWARVRRGDDEGWVEARSFERVALP